MRAGLVVSLEGVGELVNLDEARARLRPSHRDYPSPELGSRSPFGRRARAAIAARRPAAWLEEPPSGWVPYAEPCARCGLAFEGLEVRIGRARFHGRRGSCRAAAYALLTESERALAEEARRAKLWAHELPEPQQVIALDARGVPIRDADDRPVTLVAQATFPARKP